MTMLNAIQEIQEIDKTSDDLATVAEDLMSRAKTSREQGDSESFKWLLRAALNIMAEDVPPPATKAARPISPETARITEMLVADWQDVAAMADVTGLTANRVHALLGRLKASRDYKLEIQSIKRYHLIPKV